MDPALSPKTETASAETLVTLAAEIVRLENEATDHREAVKLIDGKIADAKAKIRAELGVPTSNVPAGDLVINWTPPKRSFNGALFFQHYPAEKNPHLYKLVPNNDAIPKNLKDQFMVPGTGDGTVTIK